ncbi:DUF11 domain-containing protein [bacterium]|nr:DUF11 domain-containing protein [bacterium]
MIQPFSTLIKRRNLSCLLTVVLLTIGLTTFGIIQNAQADPSIIIVKKYAQDSVIAGGPGGSFTLVVTNDGDVPLSNVSIYDPVDIRLTVTGVSGTLGADDDSDGDAQTVEWLITVLDAGQSETITVNFVVGSSVSAATVQGVDIRVDIDLSIVKTFDPIEVQQGTLQSFTIEVSNAGPSDGVDVSVTDTVDDSLAVTGASVTSGTGNCSASSDQEVDCTLQIPASESVLITVDYEAAPLQTGDSLFGTVDGSEFRFVFVNGSVLEGTANGDVFLDGVPITPGDTKNDYMFDPPGSDPAFLISLSCSDPFTGGWGQIEGPVEGVDVNWQIGFFSITQYKGGEFLSNCGNLVVPFDVPNTATASGTDSNGTQNVSDDASVTIIEPDITIHWIQANGKHVKVRLTNFTDEPKEIVDISVIWPVENGNLKKIRLGDPKIWTGSAAPPSALINSGWIGTEFDRTLQPDEEILRFDFSNNVEKSGYTIQLNFADDTFLEIFI